MFSRTCSAAALGAAAMLVSTAALAQVSDDVVKIGVLTDMSGTYSDLAGPGVIAAAEMAIADVGGKVAGKPIVLLKADHQNKADIAANKAREWGDVEHVDAYVDLVTTSPALAVMEIAKQSNKVVLVSGAGSSRITNEDCNATTIHWSYDTYAMAKGTGSALVITIGLAGASGATPRLRRLPPMTWANTGAATSPP